MYVCIGSCAKVPQELFCDGEQDDGITSGLTGRQVFAVCGLTCSDTDPAEGINASQNELVKIL